MKPRGPILHRPVVLLVEDEPLVRLVQVEILRDDRLWVVEAGDADEAFELMRGRPDIRVVVTDVDMPGSINGFEFARLVHQGWPDIGIVVTSGKMRPDPGDLPEGAIFVPKPTSADVLTAKIRSLLQMESLPPSA
ncbi:MAG TPA: response regulator [Salinarimonas sp.]|jgi:CheY-like chemotaxis protein|nr:response regulator [Salinarimonas sp.]